VLNCWTKKTVANSKKPLVLLTAFLLISLGISIGLFISPQKLPQSNLSESQPPNIAGVKSQQPDQNQQAKYQSTISSAPDAQTAKVVRAIDGDTIELDSGQKVRYIGVDTPETVSPSKPIQCFGEEASAQNKQLVEGKTVKLEKDITETDKYGRLLRFVYVDGIFVNDFLVREGFAQVSTFPPDVKYQDIFLNSQQLAQQENLGLWSSCQSKSNQSGQSSQNQSASAQAGPNGCTIKGNISTSGEKIYHMPGQKYYTKTVIDESRGEKWFCTEADALNAGWRKSSI